MFYIYKHTTPSGHCYIGQTINPDKRWKPWEYKECPKFFYAIVKYGWDNITHEIIDSCETQEEADELEKRYIKEYDSIDNGYNILTGGKTPEGENNPFYGKTHTEESKKKMRKNHKRRELTPEERQAISERNKGKNNPMYGVSVLSLMSDEKIAEWKKHLSEANKGENNPFYGKHHTEETKEKIRQKKLGVSHPLNLSEEQRKSILERSKSLWTDEKKKEQSEKMSGKNNPMYGKQYTEEEKQILREKMSGEKSPSAKPIIIYDVYEDEEILCNCRNYVKDEIGMNPSHIGRYLNKDKLYHGRYKLKEVV